MDFQSHSLIVSQKSDLFGADPLWKSFVGKDLPHSAPGERLDFSEFRPQKCVKSLRQCGKKPGFLSVMRSDTNETTCLKSRIQRLTARCQPGFEPNAF